MKVGTPDMKILTDVTQPLRAALYAGLEHKGSSPRLPRDMPVGSKLLKRPAHRDLADTVLLLQFLFGGSASPRLNSPLRIRWSRACSSW